MRTLSLMSCGVLALAGSAQAAVLVDADFDSTTTGAVANGTTINSGGTAVDDLVVNSASPNAVEVVTTGAGDNAVRTTRSANSTQTLINRDNGNVAHWSSVSTSATGNNAIQFSFDLTRLDNNADTTQTSASAGLRVLLNDGFDTSGGSVSVVDLQITRAGQVRIVDTTNSSVLASSLTLSFDTNYQFTVDVDLSSATQDTFKYTVTDLDTATIVFASPTYTTRADNVLPDRLVFDFGGVDGGFVDPDPAYLLDNVLATANPIPEPASALLALPVAALLMRRQRTK